jgi:hypothetical protein
MEVGQDGVVRAAPRAWLRMEGAALLAGSVLAYRVVGERWWWVPVGLLAPDLAIGGYVAGNRVGAHVYNLVHTTPLPLALAGVAWWQKSAPAAAVSLIWLAHIGMDRGLGFGLKYSDRFAHTHLSDQMDRG